MANGLSWWKYPVLHPASGKGMSNRVRTQRIDDHPDSYIVTRETAFRDPYDLRVLDEVEVLDLLGDVEFTPDVLSVTNHSPLSRTIVINYLGRLSDEAPPPYLTKETVRDYALRNLNAIADIDWSAPHRREGYRTALEHQRANIEAMCEDVPGSDVIPLELNGNPPTLEAALAAQVIRSARYAERRYGADALRGFGLLPADEIARKWSWYYTPPDKDAEPTRLVHRDAHLDNLTLRSAGTVDPTDPPERLIGIIDWELAGFMTPRSGMLLERAALDRYFLSVAELSELLTTNAPHLPWLRREIAQSAYNDVLRGHESVNGKRRLAVSSVTQTTELFRVAFGLNRHLEHRARSPQAASEQLAKEMVARRAAYPGWLRTEEGGTLLAPFPARPLAVRSPDRRPARDTADPSRYAGTVTVLDAVQHTAEKPAKNAPLAIPGTNRGSTPLRPAVILRDAAGRPQLPRRSR
ncbi:phosphotransferase [Marinactinospora rubrisoli]|uniref:Phosphotransferase n=1 Tax=Marinactinospora rubrisoli TaxID=2715399 RepID=A0ABW2KKH8_9ACTN